MSSRKGVPAMDILPEYFPYRDDGCEVSPSCLRCPLPQCKYDNPGWLQRERRAQRDSRVIQVRCQEGVTIPELARRFDISQRTVHRILSRTQETGLNHVQEGAEPSMSPDWRTYLPTTCEVKAHEPAYPSPDHRPTGH